MTSKHSKDSSSSELTSQTDLPRANSLPDQSELRRGAWSPSEDAELRLAVARAGARQWGAVAAALGGRRSAKSCRMRWRNYLRPELTHAPFTARERRAIVLGVAQRGRRWAAISRGLRGRTDNAVKNYWNGSLKRKYKELLAQYLKEDPTCLSKVGEGVATASTGSSGGSSSGEVTAISSPDWSPEAMAAQSASLETSEGLKKSSMEFTLEELLFSLTLPPMAVRMPPSSTSSPSPPSLPPLPAFISSSPFPSSSSPSFPSFPFFPSFPSFPSFPAVPSLSNNGYGGFQDSTGNMAFLKGEGTPIAKSNTLSSPSPSSPPCLDTMERLLRLYCCQMTDDVTTATSSNGCPPAGMKTLESLSNEFLNLPRGSYGEEGFQLPGSHQSDLWGENLYSEFDQIERCNPSNGWEYTQEISSSAIGELAIENSQNLSVPSSPSLLSHPSQNSDVSLDLLLPNIHSSHISSYSRPTQRLDSSEMDLLWRILKLEVWEKEHGEELSVEEPFLPNAVIRKSPISVDISSILC